MTKVLHIWGVFRYGKIWSLRNHIWSWKMKYSSPFLQRYVPPFLMSIQWYILGEIGTQNIFLHRSFHRMCTRTLICLSEKLQFNIRDSNVSLSSFPFPFNSNVSSGSPKYSLFIQLEGSPQHEIFFKYYFSSMIVSD